MFSADPEGKFRDGDDRFRQAGLGMLGEGLEKKVLIPALRRRGRNGLGRGCRSAGGCHGDRGHRAYPLEGRRGRNRSRHGRHHPGNGRPCRGGSRGQRLLRPAAQPHFQPQAVVGGAQTLEKGRHVRDEDFGTGKHRLVEVLGGENLALGDLQGLGGGGAGPLVHHGHFPENIPLPQLGEDHGLAVSKNADFHATAEDAVGFLAGLPLAENNLSGLKNGSDVHCVKMGNLSSAGKRGPSFGR